MPGYCWPLLKIVIRPSRLGPPLDRTKPKQNLPRRRIHTGVCAHTHTHRHTQIRCVGLWPQWQWCVPPTAEAKPPARPGAIAGLRVPRCAGNTGQAWGPTADTAGENPFARPCSRKALMEDRHLPLPTEHRKPALLPSTPREAAYSRAVDKTAKSGQPQYLSLKAWRKPHCWSRGFRGVTLSSWAKVAGRPPMRCRVEACHCFTKPKKVSLC